MSMPAIKFTFDDSPEFEGFAHGSTWNGFDNVAVSKEERVRIAEWMRATALSGDAIEEVNDLLSIPAMVENGLYSLGWGYATQIVREVEPYVRMPGDDALIAMRFVQVLRNWLKPKEWLEMCERNAVQDNPGICHSHDFCDANMAMCEAFESVVGKTPDADNEIEAKLWSDAWKLAMPALGGK
jgi:hypothetical protein